MPDSSSASALDAAIRVVRGESDRDAVLPARIETSTAHIVACAPAAHPATGWKHAHAEALIDSVQRRRSNPIVAAARIGPDDAFAALLHAPNATSFAIRMRVLSPPDAAGRCESDAP